MIKQTKLIVDIHKLLKLFNRSERLELASLVFIGTISAVIQSFSIVSLMPFISLVMDQESIFKNDYLNRIYKYFRFEGAQSFIIAIGVAIIILLVVSNGLSGMTTWLQNRFVHQRNHSLSVRLLTIYLAKPYEFFLVNNTGTLGKNLLIEISNLVGKYVKSLLALIINLVMFLSMSITLLIVDVRITLIVVLAFGGIYGLMTLLTRGPLTRSGAQLIKANTDRFIASNEAFGSVKITKSLGIEPYFIERYRKASNKFARNQQLVNLISDIPNHFVEIFAFSGIVIVILVLVSQGKNLTQYLPIISVFTMAGYRILPTITQIYKSFTLMFHNKVLLDRVYSDMTEDQVDPLADFKTIFNVHDKADLEFKEKIEIRDCSFRYQDTELIFDHFSLTIPKGQIIGFAGTTGAGKTTLIDTFLGLLKPEQGGLYVDGEFIDGQSLPRWRKIIGYVPQDIFLIDDTIRKNIAFGIPESDIDDQKIKKVAQIASIDEFIENALPDKYLTNIGERGVRLSGGQRQRIGLARALYRDPEVLILDEATSALDGATEEHVLAGIHSQMQIKTMLIIAHRLNTLKVCDNIFLLEKGKIIGQGTYDELIQINPQFMKMAKVD